MECLRAGQIFVEDDMLVFGHGGFYERPKGWGLDLCYFQKSQIAWWKPRRPLMKRICKALKNEQQQGLLAKDFASQIVRSLKKRLLHEWHYDRADMMFQAAKTTVHSLRRYDDFPAFVRMVITSGAFCTPEELEQRVLEYLRTIMPNENPLERVNSQNYLLFGFLLKTVERELTQLLGINHGEWVFARLMALAPQPPRSVETLESFVQNLLGHPAALAMLHDWHRRDFSQLLERQRDIWQSLRKLRVVRPNKRIAKKARKATLQQMRSNLPRELPALIHRLRIPVFIATSADLGYFGQFHQPGYLVHKHSGEMHQMTGLGLCVHRSYARGGIFATFRAEESERFSHTIMEECTHFADGSVDRINLRGGARYSGSDAFAAALAADYALHAPWRNNKALGLREWGLVMTQMQVPARKAAKIQQRIEAYGAALDFRHYAEEEIAAEVFATLPVIEKAVGRALARQVLPHMYVYYDAGYRAGLRAELEAVA